ncbi:site-specific integrase [Streptomyces sp. NPDC060184]|uniref:site-specific integrase n=1 Tax=Streptomyces sp. NPDC060184 TaxID=3347064 RepID=UPI00365535E3
MTPPCGKFDYLKPLFDDVERWRGPEGYLPLPAPQAASSLAVDDALLGVYGASALIRNSFAAGIAHTDALRRIVLGREVDPASPWTLLRGSLENFATAAWLLHGTGRQERRRGPEPACAAARSARRPEGAAMTSAVEPATQPAPVPGDSPVLAARPLRADCAVEDTSRFADGVWSLNPAWLRADHRRFTLDFTRPPLPVAETAKRLFYALLMQDTPPGELPISISSIRTYYGCVRRFLLWADTRGRALEQLTGEDLDDYHREVVALRLSASATKRHRRAVRLLWAYRSRLPEHLEQDPLRRPVWQAWVRSHSYRPGENLTDRIPEPVLGPLLTWALRWVDDFADDVLAARAERDAIDTRAPAWPDPLAAIHALLDDFRRRRQPLPSAPPNLATARLHPGAVPSSSYLARLIGFPEHRLGKGTMARRMIAEAARELGVDSDCPLAHAVRGQLDGGPWLQRISYYEAARLERLVQVSCWIVIAYLSGMRDSEIKHLQRGCVSVQRDPHGQIYRHRLRSLAFKGAKAPTEQKPPGWSPHPWPAPSRSWNASNRRASPTCSPNRPAHPATDSVRTRTTCRTATPPTGTWLH